MATTATFGTLHILRIPRILHILRTLLPHLVITTGLPLHPDIRHHITDITKAGEAPARVLAQIPLDANPGMRFCVNAFLSPTCYTLACRVDLYNETSICMQ
jgi:hypothetical protein